MKQNTLVQSKDPWWVKIGDFGISKRNEEAREPISTIKGTSGYMTPELQELLGNEEMYTDAHQISCAADI